MYGCTDNKSSKTAKFTFGSNNRLAAQSNLIKLPFAIRPFLYGKSIKKDNICSLNVNYSWNILRKKICFSPRTIYIIKFGTYLKKFDYSIQNFSTFHIRNIPLIGSVFNNMNTIYSYS